MIDLWIVARHALWIAGASIVVAAWSFRRTLASRYVVTGTTIFCVGMASLGSWWEALLWLAVPFALRWGHR